MKPPSVRLTRRGANRWRGGHPWIFRSDVEANDTPGGSLVRVTEPSGRVVGMAAWSDTSNIALRGVPLPRDAGVDALEAGWLGLVERSIERRRWRAGAVRLVNADGDGLPGLVIDQYGDGIAIQTLTQAAEQRREAVVAWLRERLDPKVLTVRNDGAVRTFEGLERTKSVEWGEAANVDARLGPLVLAYDLLNGQKTGGFLDQTDNRVAAACFARGDCLDCFSYDGGFSLLMAHAGRPCVAVDSSRPALDRLRQHAERNDIQIETIEDNVFDRLRAYERDGRMFDTIVLDPPAFARSRKHAEAGRRAYKEINLRAFKLLRSGGRLVTCTCSAHMRRADFETVVAEAAADARRWARVVERRSAGSDHPTLLLAPETDYLKALFIEVE